MAEKKDESKINQNPRVTKVDKLDPKIRVVKDSSSAGPNDQTVQFEPQAPAASTEEQKSLVRGAGEDKSDETLYPKPKPDIVPLSKLELEAEKKRGERTLRPSNTAKPLTFNAPDLSPARPSLTFSWHDADVASGLVDRLVRGMGLPGSQEGSGPSGVGSMLGYAKNLAKRDWDRAQSSGKTVNGMEPNSSEPTEKSVNGGWHHRLAKVMSVFGDDEDALRKHAAYHGASFESHVDALHSVAQQHFDFYKAKTIRHPVREGTDFFQDPKSGRRIPVSENHPSMPKDESGAPMFERTKGEFVGVTRDPQTMRHVALPPRAQGWEVMSHDDGTRTFYKVRGGDTGVSLVSHLSKEIQDAKRGLLTPKRRGADVASGLAETFSGTFRGKVDAEGKYIPEPVEETRLVRDVPGQEPISGLYKGKGRNRKRANVSRVTGNLNEDGTVAARPPRPRVSSGGVASASPMVVKQGAPKKSPAKPAAADNPIFSGPAPKTWRQGQILFSTGTAGGRGVDEALDREQAERQSSAFPRPNPSTTVTGEPVGGEQSTADWVPAPSKRRRRRTGQVAYQEGIDFGPQFPQLNTPTTDAESRTGADRPLITGEDIKKQRLNTTLFGEGTLVKTSSEALREARKKI